MAIYKKLLKNRNGDIIIPVADIDGFYATEDWVIAQLGDYLPKNYVVNSSSTSSGYTYDVRYINNLIKTSDTSSDNATYSCNYIDNNFLTLETLPRYDGGVE